MDKFLSTAKSRPRRSFPSKLPPVRCGHLP
jgi:hypothetical protein